MQGDLPAAGGARDEQQNRDGDAGVAVGAALRAKQRTQDSTPKNLSGALRAEMVYSFVNIGGPTRGFWNGGPSSGLPTGLSISWTMA